MMKCMAREGRPIYEPPVFNYERFTREAIPSEEKLSVMFFDDPPLKTTFKRNADRQGTTTHVP